MQPLICIAARSPCRWRWRSPTGRHGVDGRRLIAALAAGYEVGLRGRPRGDWQAVHAWAPLPGRVRTVRRRRERRRPPAVAAGRGASCARHCRLARRRPDGGPGRRNVEAPAFRIAVAQAGVVGADLLQHAASPAYRMCSKPPYGGFLSTLSGEPELAHLTRGLGTDWEIRKVGFKPYATAASVQSVLFAIDGLMAENALTASDIRARHFNAAPWPIAIARWPVRAYGCHGRADEHVLRRRHDDHRSQRNDRSVPRRPPLRSGGAGDESSAIADRGRSEVRRRRPTRRATTHGSS